MIFICACLAACETAPRAGSITQAQVLKVVRDRHDSEDGHPELYAALRAGVTRRELENGRLFDGECALPDRALPSGMRWHRVTVLVPAGLHPASGTEVEVSALRAAWPTPDGRTPERLHGVYRSGVTEKSTAPGPTAPATVFCQTPGSPPEQWRVKLRSPLPAWMFDFAEAGLRRLDALRESDLAAGRVLRVGCQLKVADGSDWYVPIWLATAPDNLHLQVGHIVSLRVGAELGSKDPGPQAEILARTGLETGRPGSSVPRCG